MFDMQQAKCHVTTRGRHSTCEWWITGNMVDISHVSITKWHTHVHRLTYNMKYFVLNYIRRRSRFQWSCCLMRGSTAGRFLGLQVRIPPGVWMSISYECCVLSGRGLCDGLITRPEESYRVWCVWVWSSNLGNEEAKAQRGLLRHGEKNPVIITRHRSCCHSLRLKGAEQGGRTWKARNTYCYVRKFGREIS